MAHKKRYKKLSRQLCEQAVVECFKGKWRRNDVLTFIEKYAGIPRDDIKIDDLSGSWKYKNEAVEAIGLAMLGIVEDLVDHGIEPDDMEPVTIRQRPDGMTGKIRDIALLCIMHQLIGHITKLMIEPLIQARLLPTQHASIPGHGQTMLKDQMLRYFLKESLGIEYVRKTDVVHAYASLQYDVCIDLVMMEIPKARYAIGLLKYLKSVAPGGHLIIGGYLDAWLFNFAMSYAIRYLYTLGSTRRGKKIPYVIRCGTFMDDFSIGSGSIKGEQRAVKALDKWMTKNQHLQIKETTGIIKLLPIEEEKRRRNLPRPGQRGVPMLDMAGYRISRTHITIRRRVFKRARRQLIRGYRELKRDGTLRRERAQKIIWNIRKEWRNCMIYLNVDADQKPEKVMMENLPGGAMTVRMADNIKEYRQEDAKDRKMYRFDEVVFELPADSTITTKQIEDDFEKYWEYGKTDQAGKDEDMKDDEPDPESGGMTRAEMTVEIQKLQEKNEMLESCLLEMSELVYA